MVHVNVFHSSVLYQNTPNCGCVAAWQDCSNNIAVQCPPMSPSVSPAPIDIPSEAPTSPIVSSCPQPPPIPQAICTTNGWIVLGPVSTTTVTISGNVAINGSVQVSEGITFTGLNSHLVSTGCISIGGRVAVELSEEEVRKLDSSNSQRILASQAEGCQPIDRNTPLILKQASSQTKSCKKLKMDRDTSQPATQFAVLFEFDKSRCNLWWIILVSVVGGILVIVVIVVLLAMFTPLKKVIRPFTQRKDHSD
jgi:hypothetical protein